MAYTDIHSEDRLVQATFAEQLERVLGWESVYAWNQETFGPMGTLGRTSEREAVLVRDLRSALVRLNPELPPPAIDDAVTQLTHHDFSRSLLQHNQAFHKMLRDGVPVSYRDAHSQVRHTQARVMDFREPANNRFLVVRELKLTGLRTPNYNRRADLVCFVNGLPLVFIELKAVYKNIRAGFDGNLREHGRKRCGACVSPQRIFGGEQRAQRPVWLDHQHLGALWRVEAPERKRRGQCGRRGVAERHAGQRPFTRHPGKLHLV